MWGVDGGGTGIVLANTVYRDIHCTVFFLFLLQDIGCGSR